MQMSFWARHFVDQTILLLVGAQALTRLRKSRSSDRAELSLAAILQQALLHLQVGHAQPFQPRHSH